MVVFTSLNRFRLSVQSLLDLWMLLRIMKALIQKAFLVEYKYSKEREEEEEQLL